MGMFDSVFVGCAHCGEPVEFQSKEGECNLNGYSVKTAPTEVLTDVLNEPHYCRHCGHWSALYDPAFPPGGEPLRPIPTMRKVRDPLDSEFDAHQQQTYLRWWRTEFTEADLTP